MAHRVCPHCGSIRRRRTPRVAIIVLRRSSDFSPASLIDRGASFLLSRRLQLNRETLHHQSDRRENTVQVYPLRIQRQYTRFRRPGRQPPHPGRYRYQSARFRGAPPAHDVFIPRCSAEHLAGVIRGYLVPTPIFFERTGSTNRPTI